MCSWRTICSGWNEMKFKDVSLFCQTICGILWERVKVHWRVNERILFHSTAGHWHSFWLWFPVAWLNPPTLTPPNPPSCEAWLSALRCQWSGADLVIVEWKEMTGSLVRAQGHSQKYTQVQIYVMAQTALHAQTHAGSQECMLLCLLSMHGWVCTAEYARRPCGQPLPGFSGLYSLPKIHIFFAEILKSSFPWFTLSLSYIL